MVLLLLSLRYGIRTSPAQFFFYFFSLITGAATLRSIIFRKMESDDNNFDPNDNNDTYNGEADYDELDNYYCDNCDPDASDQLLYFYAIQYGLHVLLFFLNCIVDVKPKKYDERIKILKNPCPKLDSAYFSRLFYFWCDSLLWLGFRKPLVTTDLWDMDPVVTSR